MEQITITAKIQISATADDKVLLNKTMSVYSDACNYVSDYVFRTHDLKQFSLNKALYSTLRERFGLKSQMAQSVFKTVIAKYKTVLENESKWIKPSFKKPQYDLVWNRDYSLTQNCFSVNTLSGRVKLPYFAEGMSKYFDRYGVMHRNSFLDSPRLLDADYHFRGQDTLYFAGQMTGVEGYMESAASGILAGKNLARRLQGKAPLILPRETMMGALAAYGSRSRSCVWKSRRHYRV